MRANALKGVTTGGKSFAIGELYSHIESQLLSFHEAAKLPLNGVEVEKANDQHEYCSHRPQPGIREPLSLLNQPYYILKDIGPQRHEIIREGLQRFLNGLTFVCMDQEQSIDDQSTKGAHHRIESHRPGGW